LEKNIFTKNGRRLVYQTAKNLQKTYNRKSKLGNSSKSPNIMKLTIAARNPYFEASQYWLPFLMQYPYKLLRHSQLGWIDDAWIDQN
jgi:hypothetical protein